jgi:GNAT superfamily N-acetyltransferase
MPDETAGRPRTHRWPSPVIELEDVFVHPGWMRRGIATALVNRIAGVLRSRGAERLEVTVSPHALEFYRAMGFTDCGVAETDFGTAPRMVLAIS